MFKNIIQTGVILMFALAFSYAVCAQPVKQKSDLDFPGAYHSMKTDIERMQFLVPAIQDSLDEGQLTHVYNWARTGFAMASKNNVDSMKGIFLYDIAKAFAYQYYKYDSAIFYYKQVPAYFPDKMRKYNVFSIREIMDRYADLGNKDSSFAYMDQLKALIDTMAEDAAKKISLSQNIAAVYQGFGMYRTAIHYFQIAINGERKRNNLRGLGLALANLGELYNQMDNQEKAIAISKEALLNLVDVNRPFMQTASNIADYYITLGNQDSALYYLNISNKVVEKINDNESRLANQTILAKIYLAKQNYPAAKKLLDETITALSQSDDSWTMCRALLNYTDMDINLKNYDIAKAHLQKVITIAQKNNFVPFSILALQKMAGIYSSSGDYKNAWQYQLEYVKLKDSAVNAKSQSDLNDLEVTYKTLQKEQEIVLLKKDNDVKTLQLKNSRQSFIFYIIGFTLLLLIAGIIIFQRQRRQKIQNEKMKAELQTQILRSQMNPHFIFNCLNSIENFIMHNDKRQASDYLNKFSLLIRNILNSSRNEVVPIVKDMEALQLYIELEQLRFNYKFDYKVFIDPALASGDYRVPALLIQPFVENAIVHGLAHSEEEDLKLIITASLVDETILYSIQDNGIGREKAKVYNMQNKPFHKSVGLKITEERINMYNKQHRQSIRIIDLYDENKNPGGTKIEIVLKAV